MELIIESLVIVLPIAFINPVMRRITHSGGKH